MASIEDQARAFRWYDDKQLVKTIKGAQFRGHVVGHYVNYAMDHIGVVVLCDVDGMRGCVHVYPITQLEAIT